MFGFFKKKKNEEQLLNKGIFLFHFANIFDDSDTTKMKLEEKLGIFPVHLTSIISEKAINSTKPFCEYNSYEKAASVVVFNQILFNIVDFIGYTNKSMLSNLIANVGMGMVCKDSNNPTSQEHADLALAGMTYSRLGKEHVYILESISDNCLEWLFHREEEPIDNLVAAWRKIISIIST